MKKFLKLLIFLCCCQQVYSQQLETNFDLLSCIKEGTTVTLTCMTEGPLEHGATIWSGSPQIFNCPSNNSVSNNQLYLRHLHSPEATAKCGEHVSANLHSTNDSSRVTVYTSTIYITTTLDMNGGSVMCSTYQNQSVQLNIEGLFFCQSRMNRACGIVYVRNSFSHCMYIYMHIIIHMYTIDFK